MKRNITLCLDEEVIELLSQEDNKSATTNQALINFFGFKKTANEEMEIIKKEKEAIAIKELLISRELDEEEKENIKNEEARKIFEKKIEDEEAPKRKARIETMMQSYKEKSKFAIDQEKKLVEKYTE